MVVVQTRRACAASSISTVSVPTAIFHTLTALAADSRLHYLYISGCEGSVMLPNSFVVPYQILYLLFSGLEDSITRINALCCNKHQRDQKQKQLHFIASVKLI